MALKSAQTRDSEFWDGFTDDAKAAGYSHFVAVVMPAAHHQNFLTGDTNMAHQGYDNARQRRNDKRKALTAAYNAAHGIEERECCVSDRPTLSLNRKAMSRVNKAVSVHTTKAYDTLNNCCLPEVAIFSVKSKKNENITARV